MWSSLPDVSSSGPRTARWVSTFAGEFREKLAVASSNSGRPGPGIVHASNRASDSSSVRVLPKLYRNCLAVSETVRFLFAGLPSTGNPERSCENGRVLTPLMGAGSMATAATARSLARSSCAMRPPNECPMTIGFASSVSMWSA